MRNVRSAAEFVVDGPVPNRIGMSVEENSAFHFSRAFFDCGDAVSRLLGEAFVNEFFVKTELNEQNHKTECRQNCAEYRQKEEKNHACKHKRDREINPTEKRVGVFGECFHVRSFASAVVFQVICHVLARHFLAFRAGIALWHVVADMRDFVAHKLRALRFVVDKFLKFSHKLLPCFKIIQLYYTFVRRFNMRFAQNARQKSTIYPICMFKILNKSFV